MRATSSSSKGPDFGNRNTLPVRGPFQLAKIETVPRRCHDSSSGTTQFAPNGGSFGDCAPVAPISTTTAININAGGRDLFDRPRSAPERVALVEA